MTSAFRAVCVALVCSAPAVAADRPDEPKPVAKPAEKTDAEKLQGVWLFDGYRMNTQSNLSTVWTSVVTVTGNTFSITKVYDSDKPFTGKLTLDSVQKTIDFTPEVTAGLRGNQRHFIHTPAARKNVAAIGRSTSAQ